MYCIWMLEAYQEAEEDKRGLQKLNVPNANTRMK